MNSLSLRKKLVSAACAATLAFSVPALAFALPSPSNSSTATGTNNVVALVGATTPSGEAVDSGMIIVTPVTQVAAGSPGELNPSVNAETLEGTGQVVIASFEVISTYEGEIGAVELAFNVGTQYAGATAHIYIRHNDGSVETRDGVVASDGVVAISVDRLSIFTIAIDLNTIPENSGANVDKGDTSPQTGVSVLAVAVGTGVMACAAAGTGFALCKKVRG